MTRCGSFPSYMESSRPDGNDVNDTASETAALHSGKPPARDTQDWRDWQD
ncbi:MAG: hypothetical protein IKR48_03000 [Kiritimatiellae bacterium]|nr:hypothetical protein [Kiritimatiellia bacterium]